MSDTRVVTFADSHQMYTTGKRQGQQWHSVGIKDDVIWDTTSIFRAGETKTGKTWTKFEYMGSDFWSKKQGRLRILQKRVLPADRRRAKKVITFQDRTAYTLEDGFLAGQSAPFLAFLAEWYPAIDPFSETADPTARWQLFANRSKYFEEMRKIIRETEYPLSEIFELQVGLTSSLTGTMEELALRQFKPSRYRKDLVKALGGLQAQTRPDAANRLMVGVAVAPFVPMDWVISFLNRPPVPPPAHRYPAWQQRRQAASRFDYKPLRRMFRMMTEKQLRRALLKAEFTPNDLMYIADSAISAEKILDADLPLAQYTFQDWAQWHDLMDREARKVQDRNRLISYSGKHAVVAGPVTVNNVPPFANEELVIKAATGTHEVVDWGASMNHCIGSYANQAADGTTWLYAIELNGKLLANMQLSKSGSVSQLYGKHNRRIESKYDGAIRAHVADIFGLTNEGLLLNNGRPRANGGFIAAANALNEFGIAMGNVVAPAQPGLALANWERDLLEGF